MMRIMRIISLSLRFNLLNDYIVKYLGPDP